MLSPCLDDHASLPEPDLGRLNDDVVEMSLLLPGWQLAALETMARSQGQSAGQMLRGLVRKFLLENS